MSDEKVECAGCRFMTTTPFKTTRRDSVGPSTDPRVDICPLCAHTLAGTALMYPKQYSSETRGVLAAINFNTNLLAMGQMTEAEWVRVMEEWTSE